MIMRKNYEEAEANAIGTAYARADLLPSRFCLAGAAVTSRIYCSNVQRFYTVTDYTFDTSGLLSELYTGPPAVDCRRGSGRQWSRRCRPTRLHPWRWWPPRPTTRSTRRAMRRLRRGTGFHRAPG